MGMCELLLLIEIQDLNTTVLIAGVGGAVGGIEGQTEGAGG